MTERPRLSSRAKWAVLAAVSILGILMTLAAAEGLIRLRQWSKYGTAVSYEKLYAGDQKTDLRVPVAGVRLGNISVNALGFRGPEIDVPKPSGRIRLAFLGASTTFCAEVSSDGAVWPHLVGDRLRARFPDTEFDFVNGGVPGYTVRSSIRNLQYRIDPLDPDVVVIYHATNDFSAEVNRLAELQGLAAAGSNRPNWLARNSLLWELIEKNMRVMAAQRAADVGMGHVVLDKSRLGAEFGRDLTELVEAAGRGNRRVALATFSTRLRPEQSTEEMKRAAVSALVYMPFMDLQGLLLGYRRYNDVIRETAMAQGALLIGGETDIPADAAHFVDSVHFSDAGSRAMADRVFTALVNDHRFEALVAARRKR